MGTLDYIRHKTKIRLMAGEYVHWVNNCKRAPYLRAAVLSAPPWVKRADFRHLEVQRDRLTAETGIQHVIDHDVPLDHPVVCGLTVPWNMVVRTWIDNARKGNWFPDDQQLQLF